MDHFCVRKFKGRNIYFNKILSRKWKFNNTYSKEIKEIEIEDEYDFEGQLVIGDYSDLEKLYLHDVCSIEKIILKNLIKLQECTIWDCGLKDLVIENCPQLKKLNACSNSLTGLEFLTSLENLEELEIDNNVELASGIEYLPKSLKNFSSL